MENGWIKLHRKIRDNPFYSNPVASSLWIECLLRAGCKSRQFYWKRELVDLKPGQFLFGYEELGSMFKISRSTVRYWISAFIVATMLDVLHTPKGSIGTIKNWDHYQSVATSVATSVANKKPTKSQQKATNKKDKKVKKVENDIYTPPIIPPRGGEPAKGSIDVLSSRQFREQMADKFPRVDVGYELDKAADWLRSKGKRYKDYEAFGRNWLRRKDDESPKLNDPTYGFPSFPGQ